MINKILIFRVCSICICFSLAVVAFSGRLEPVIQRLGTGALNNHNDVYLNTTFNKALAGFGVMSGIKAGLAVIEGSSAGVSAGATVNLQVGDAVQSVYDYVDIAWRTLLTGCITILSMQYLLKAADLANGFLLGCMFILLGANLLFRQRPARFIVFRGVLRYLLSISIAVTLAILFILPLSIWGASHLSRMITQPQIEEAQSGFKETQEAFFPDNDTESGGFFSTLKNMPERIQQTAISLKQNSTKMATWSIKLIAGYVFDCIVFPLTSFILLLWLTRSIVQYGFQTNLSSSLREDIEKILITHTSNREQ